MTTMKETKPVMPKPAKTIETDKEGKPIKNKSVGEILYPSMKK